MPGCRNARTLILQAATALLVLCSPNTHGTHNRGEIERARHPRFCGRDDDWISHVPEPATAPGIRSSELHCVGLSARHDSRISGGVVFDSARPLSLEAATAAVAVQSLGRDATAGRACSGLSISRRERLARSPQARMRQPWNAGGPQRNRPAEVILRAGRGTAPTRSFNGPFSTSTRNASRSAGWPRDSSRGRCSLRRYSASTGRTSSTTVGQESR